MNQSLLDKFILKMTKNLINQDLKNNHIMIMNQIMVLLIKKQIKNKNPSMIQMKLVKKPQKNFYLLVPSLMFKDKFNNLVKIATLNKIDQLNYFRQKMIWTIFVKKRCFRLTTRSVRIDLQSFLSKKHKWCQFHDRIQLKL